ncbi:MAG: AraC family transcriptional regulator [Planctomycetota bacterium]|jgi:AraC-like DNA-binding protein|nr:AraC family transcriptional regulator [Planctomycetota bacterium]
MAKNHLITARSLFDAEAGFAAARVATTGTWRFPQHRHRGFSEFLYLIEGNLIQHIDGRKLITKPGDLVLVKEHQTHALDVEHGVTFYNINFDHQHLHNAAALVDPALDTEALLVERGLQHWRVEAEQRRYLGQLCSRMFLEQGKPHARRLLMLFLAHVCVEHLLSDQASAPETGLPPWLGDLLTDIDSQIDRGLRAADLAELAGRSPAHVSRSFRQFFECTPSAFLNRRRLHRAALLLEHSNQAIVDIVYELGFNSSSYFYRLFQAQYGIAPAEFRRKRGWIGGSQ